jgi:hypothetical protein
MAFRLLLMDTALLLYGGYCATFQDAEGDVAGSYSAPYGPFTLTGRLARKMHESACPIKDCWPRRGLGPHEKVPDRCRPELSGLLGAALSAP